MMDMLIARQAALLGCERPNAPDFMVAKNP
jgi:hypothetical protein